MELAGAPISMVSKWAAVSDRKRPLPAALTGADRARLSALESRG